MTRIEEIRARCEKASKGPWLADGPFIYALNEQGVNRFSAGFSGGNRESAKEPERTATAEFCAAAISDVPYLLDAVDRLTAAHEEILQLRSAEAMRAVARRALTPKEQDHA